MPMYHENSGGRRPHGRRTSKGMWIRRDLVVFRGMIRSSHRISKELAMYTSVKSLMCHISNPG